ncbi:MAG: SDR family oxidoreductase [Deltaproteobacteria bacterium]|nr:SDR family oxidoreductase [Deltaproteobacteria bacterium]
MKLTGHRVLVTGGTSGIGLALARALLQRGNRVAVCGRRQAALDRATASAPGLLAFPFDLADEATLARLPGEVESRLGGLSLLVNNAGVQHLCDFTRDPTEELLRRIDEEIAVNLAGLARVTAVLLPLLRRAPGAALLNVSSGLGLVPKRSAPVYCATKAGVHLFTRALRWQLQDAGAGVEVFELLPPLVDTPMTEGRGKGKLSPEEVAEAALRGMAAGREEIRVGKVRLLAALNRLAPRLAERALRNA